MKYLLALYSCDPSKLKAGNIQRIAPEDSQATPHQIIILEQPNVKVICDECDHDITLLTYMACGESDYCVSCFGNLEAFPQTFSVHTSLNYSMTEPEWLGAEEALLLGAFQRWGFGNWNQITDFMNFNGSKFNKMEIQSHYDRVYLSNSDNLPNINYQLVDHSKSERARQAKRYSGELVNKTPRKQPQLKSEDSLPPSKKSPPGPKENILGYNPKRKCFNYDLEYDEKAECMLADLEFKDDDTPEEIQLKFRIIENYNKRLDERQKRYQFTIDHHILDIDYRFKKQFSGDKYQKEAFNLFKPFTRFQTHQENEKTKDLIATNNYYKGLIQGLKKARKKIDREGRIEQTLNYLREKQKDYESLGKSRKIYHIDHNSATYGQQEVIKKLQEEIQKDSDNPEQKTNLKVVYRSF